MKNSIYAVLAASATIMAGTAFGGTQVYTAYNDYVTGILPGFYLSAPAILPGVSSSLSDTFDLTADGFIPGTDVATSGQAYFDITDLVNVLNLERISIDLGSIDELPRGTVHDYSFSFDSGGGTSDLDILADINADGKLNYTITATRGDFFVTDAELDVTATVPDSSTPAAPDATSTLALLGAGVSCLGFASRKFRSSK